jgi:subtilisin family serine protease
MTKRVHWLAAVVLFFAAVQPAAAAHRFLIRTTLGLPGLQTTCLLHTCTVVRALDGTLNQVFLLTTPDFVDSNLFLVVLRALPGIVDAEADQLLAIPSGLAVLTSPPANLSQNSPVDYYGSQVWQGYAMQPASQIIRLFDARAQFQVNGTGIVADIDTGVDPTHPALSSVLLTGYDFTRNQPGGSELPDWTYATPPSCPDCPAATVNQSTAAVLDQSTAAVLDGTPYAAFGHGTMVAGVIHLTAPTALILPLKAFHANGTGYLSDIVRAIYYAVQNQANVINMSFDFTAPSQELADAMSYANENNVICVASVGNDGQQITTYPASIASVMGVASTSDLDTRSTFSNYGPEVWVAAPGEDIVTTYPFGTYAAASGTSFSSPFVAGTAALLRSANAGISANGAALAIGHAQQVGAGLGNGRLDVYRAVESERE